MDKSPPSLNKKGIKDRHLKVCLEKAVESTTITSGFERYRFVHQALPEIDRKEISTSSTIFGKNLNAPLIISAMTGGTELAGKINRNLAKAAQILGLGMEVGSQKLAIEDPSLAYSYLVRDVAPEILLFANLGAVHLNYGYGIKQCIQAVELIGADGLSLYLNPLQEAIQKRGKVNFKGIGKKIKEVCESVDFPVLVKEIGCGFSEEVAARLRESGVSGLEVAGSGGASWARIEQLIEKEEKYTFLDDPFADWGIPTADSLLSAVKAAPDLVIIASGGIRSGVDMAKAIALGASATGITLPLVKPAMESADAVIDRLASFIEELKTSMFCIGASSLSELSKTSLRSI